MIHLSGLPCTITDQVFAKSGDNYTITETRVYTISSNQLDKFKSDLQASKTGVQAIDVTEAVSDIDSDIGKIDTVKA